VNFGSLFAGIGGFDLGLERAGMTCLWQVEIDDYATKVLEKHWPNVKRFRDVREIKEGDLEAVDLICGGFPCQDVSTASKTRAGIRGERSSLWGEFARIIGMLRPRYVIIENVPAIRARGLTMVLQDIAALGYDAEWHCVPASAIGAPHQRDRIWIIAYPAGTFRRPILVRPPSPDDADIDGVGCRGRARESSPRRGPEPEDCTAHANTLRPRLENGPETGSEGEAPALLDAAGRCVYRGAIREPLAEFARLRGERTHWAVEPGVVRMVYGVSNRVDRIRCLGNAVVPQMAEWLGRMIMAADLHALPINEGK